MGVVIYLVVMNALIKKDGNMRCQIARIYMSLLSFFALLSGLLQPISMMNDKQCMDATY
jgi:hypothetical protein